MLFEVTFLCSKSRMQHAQWLIDSIFKALVVRKANYSQPLTKCNPTWRDSYRFQVESSYVIFNSGCLSSGAFRLRQNLEFWDVVTTPQIGERSIVMSASVCVCMSVRDHIFGTTRPIFTKSFMPITYIRGSVILWRRSDTLCTSGLVDDVIFARTWDKLLI